MSRAEQVHKLAQQLNDSDDSKTTIWKADKAVRDAILQVYENVPLSELMKIIPMDTVKVLTDSMYRDCDGGAIMGKLLGENMEIAVAKRLEKMKNDFAK